jgi:hypothetical protein
MKRDNRSGSIRRRRAWFHLAAALGATAVLMLSGCGGGSGGGAAAPVAGSGDGQLTVAMRDAAGDFLSYAVDVTSLRLERANGDVVETVPLTTRIDFSDLAELTEFFTVATIPSGTYTRVVTDLDFTNAQIVVQNDAGAELPAVAVDAAGNPITTLSVVIELPDSEPVRIVPGIPAAVTLDFDLDASNAVDLTTSPPKVTVQPFLSVIPQLERDRDHRVRGVLASVDDAADTVTLKVRPFHLRQGEFGEVTFATDDRTRFEVNGAALVGSEGLAAVAALAQGTPVVAKGTVTNRTLTASMVLAGSSVPWANGDVVHGVVTARSGDVLTVKGADCDFADGTHGFRGSFTVRLGDDTRVTSLDSDSMARTKDAISVGQRIIAFGQMTGASTLDATAGRVRMEMTRLTGNVVQLDPLMVNLVELGGLRPGAFDFSGTGTSAATDADPAQYVVDTSTLSLAGLVANDLVKVRGLVHEFGAAPPAFDARTVIDVDTDSIGAWFWASWRQTGGSANPFATVAQDRLDVDLTDARHTLNLLGVPRDALGDGDRIALIGPSDVRGIYMVTVRGANEVHLFRDFAGLTPALANQLDAGNRLVQINAIGRYNASSLELTTPRASFEFTAP